MDHGEAVDRWTRLRQVRGELDAASQAWNFATVAERLSELGRIITAGVEAEAVWKRLYEAINKKGRAAQREWRRLRDLRMVMPADQVLLLMTSIAHSIKAHARDPVALRGIAQDLAGLLADARQRSELQS